MSVSRAPPLPHQSDSLTLVRILLPILCLIMVLSGNQANHSTKGHLSNRLPVPNDNEIKQEWMFDPVINDEVVHFKVSSSAVTLTDEFAPLHQQLVYRLWVHPGVGRSMSVNTCMPVIVTELNDNDFTFKPQQHIGTHVTQPFTVFKTRVPDYRNAVSSIYRFKKTLIFHYFA